jgi:hypothetical protein
LYNTHYNGPSFTIIGPNPPLQPLQHLMSLFCATLPSHK